MGFRPWDRLECAASVAEDVGVEAAIILHDVVYWVSHNQNREECHKNDNVWTYGNYSDFTARFPFLGSGRPGIEKARRLIKKLETAGYVVVENFENPNPSKRLVPTIWITVTQKTIENYTTIAQAAKHKNVLSRTQKCVIDNTNNTFPTLKERIADKKEYRAKASDTASPAVAWAEKMGISRDSYEMLSYEFGEPIVNAQIPIIATRKGVRNPYALLRRACVENWAEEKQEKTCVKSAWEQAVDLLGGA